MRFISRLLTIGLLMFGISFFASGNEKNMNYPQSLSDEFDSQDSLSSWQIFNREKLSKLEIESGVLVFEPSKTASRIAWYEDDQGPLLYKKVKGNFIVDVKLKIVTMKDHNIAPSSQFNSAGIVIRDPRSKDGRQNWIMYNIGYQYLEFGREAKTTDNSSSILSIYGTAADNNSGKIRFCRINNVFYLYHWLANESKWIVEDAADEFERNDFQDSLDVGVVINASGSPRETRAEFDYIRFKPATTKNDCVK